TPSFGGPWALPIGATGKNFGGPRARRTLARSWRLLLQRSALDYQVREQSQDVFAIDVRGCRYAEFYKELGEPELGFLLVCSSNCLMAEGFDPDITPTPTQPIMQGASHCNFRYRRQRDPD